MPLPDNYFRAVGKRAVDGTFNLIWPHHYGRCYLDLFFNSIFHTVGCPRYYFHPNSLESKLGAYWLKKRSFPKLDTRSQQPALLRWKKEKEQEILRITNKATVLIDT